MFSLFKKKHLSWLDALLQCRSVSPHDDGAQPLIASFIKEIDSSSHYEVAHGALTSNTAYHIQGNHNHFIFAGHTDVVPALEFVWSQDPFKLTTKNESELIGRGIVDMKGAIICFLAAVEYVMSLNKHPSIHILLTSNEEACGHEGLQYLLQQISLPECALVVIGEPSAHLKPGDCIKTGRRGSLHGEVQLTGQAYHVAYAENHHPLYYLESILTELKAIDWDLGQVTPFFTKSSFQITKIQTQECVENVIPSHLSIRFNIRYSPVTSLTTCNTLLENLLNAYPLESSIAWRQGAIPWRSALAQKDIDALLGAHPAYKGYLSTDGGVSDGYKIATHLSDRIIEVGLSHQSAHQTNEWTTFDDLNTLTSLYAQLLLKIALL